MQFASLRLRSHQEKKAVGLADLWGTILISHSIILRIFSSTWFRVAYIYSFMILNENRKMSYHLPNYFPRTSFTLEFTFPFPSGIRTLPETNVLFLEWRYLPAKEDFAQTREKNKLGCKISYCLGQLISAFPSWLLFYYLNFKKLFSNNLTSLLKSSAMKP